MNIVNRSFEEWGLKCKNQPRHDGQVVMPPKIIYKDVTVHHTIDIDCNSGPSAAEHPGDGAPSWGRTESKQVRPQIKLQAA